MNSNFSGSKRSVVPKDDTYQDTTNQEHILRSSQIFWVIISFMAGNISKNYSCRSWGPKKATLPKYLAKKSLCNRNICYYEGDPGFQEMLILSGKQKEGAGGGGQRGREQKKFLTYSRRGVRTVRSRPCFPRNNSYIRDISYVNRPRLCFINLVSFI